MRLFLLPLVMFSSIAVADPLMNKLDGSCDEVVNSFEYQERGE